MTEQVDVENFRKPACRYCDTPLGASFLDLGLMPLANSFPCTDQPGYDEFRCPLNLVFCPTCTLVQLTHVVPADLMFSTYLYVSSTTKTFQEHFSNYARAVKTRLCKAKGAVAVDIGSNDGLLISCYQQEGMKAVGVEPAKNLSDEANQKGLATINRYFDSACVDEILKRYGHVQVVSANNVFAHVDDIQGFCRNLVRLLADNGMFVLEVPYLPTMVEELFFDMIYHEHLSYLSVSALDFLFKRFRLSIFAVDYVPSHGGSVRVFVQKENGPYPAGREVDDFLVSETRKGYRAEEIYRSFAERVVNVRKQIVHLVDEIKGSGKSISGYGAPAKAATLINYCGFDRAQIDYVVDDNPLKQNRRVPGTQISILPGSALKSGPTDFVIIFAWNFADEIMRKLQDLKGKRVRFVIPLATPRIVEQKGKLSLSR